MNIKAVKGAKFTAHNFKVTTIKVPWKRKKSITLCSCYVMCLSLDILHLQSHFVQFGVEFVLLLYIFSSSSLFIFLNVMGLACLKEVFETSVCMVDMAIVS